MEVRLPDASSGLARRLAASLGKVVAVVCVFAPILGCVGAVAAVAARVSLEQFEPARAPTEMDLFPGLDEYLRWGSTGFWTGAGGVVAAWLTWCFLRRQRAPAALTLLLLAALAALWLHYDLNCYDSKVLHTLDVHFGVKLPRHE